MVQFDVHRNPAGPGRTDIPYVVDVQSDLLWNLPTRLVVPLMRESAFGASIGRLHPRFVVADTAVILLTTEIGVLPPRALGGAVANLVHERSSIIAAIDMLISGV